MEEKHLPFPLLFFPSEAPRLMIFSWPIPASPLPTQKSLLSLSLSSLPPREFFPPTHSPNRPGEKFNKEQTEIIESLFISTLFFLETSFDNLAEKPKLVGDFLHMPLPRLLLFPLFQLFFCFPSPLPQTRFLPTNQMSCSPDFGKKKLGPSPLRSIEGIVFCGKMSYVSQYQSHQLPVVGIHAILWYCASFMSAIGK